MCGGAGFKQILLRGDTDFSQTGHLDGWDAKGWRFIFGIDARSNLTRIADDLAENQWKRLQRPAKYNVKTNPRRRPVNVKVDASPFLAAIWLSPGPPNSSE